jgi:hypothetical protein
MLRAASTGGVLMMRINPPEWCNFLVAAKTPSRSPNRPTMGDINPIEGFDCLNAARTLARIANRAIPKQTRTTVESSTDVAGLPDGWFGCEGPVLWGKEV